MTRSANSSDLASTVSAELERYFRHMAARVEKAARSVTEQQLWTKPFPFGNSIGHLILHLTGNLNHYIGSIIAGSGYTRDREHEFTDTERYPLDDLLRGFHEAVDTVGAHSNRRMHRRSRRPFPASCPSRPAWASFLSVPRT